MTARTATASWGDRFAPYSVALVTLAALLLGWAVKARAEGRVASFSAQGVSALVPAGWTAATAGDRLLVASDPLGKDTAYGLQLVPTPNGDLPNAAASLSLRRAQDWMGYRVLDQSPVTVDSRAGYRVNFVYVDSDPTLSTDHLPVVVRGVDYLFASGDRAVVVTLTAERGEFDAALARFRRFLASVSW
ncbi:MAG: hypothetical protein HY784_12395 [Chloroflexi bacterium]|nr:hypothetical protein [Chloroflexota bacterium]